MTQPTPDPLLRQALRTLSAPPVERVTGLAVTRVGQPAGQAPSVVLVHGLGAARTTWAPMLTSLAERYDVIAVDLPGHGDSASLADGEAADPAALGERVNAALQAMDVHLPYLIGNSLGGWVGLELAAAGRLAGLTALAPAGMQLEPGRPNRWLRVNRQLALATGPIAGPLLAVAAVRRLTFTSGSADPAALDVDLARSVAHALRACTGYERTLDATQGRRFDRAGQVDVPLTVVFGDDDRILPAPGNQQRAAAPPHARWVVLRRCGHAPQWDAPRECLELFDQTVAAAGS